MTAVLALCLWFLAAAAAALAFGALCRRSEPQTPGAVMRNAGGGEQLPAERQPQAVPVVED